MNNKIESTKHNILDKNLITKKCRKDLLIIGVLEFLLFGLHLGIGLYGLATSGVGSICGNLDIGYNYDNDDLNDTLLMKKIDNEKPEMTFRGMGNMGLMISAFIFIVTLSDVISSLQRGRCSIISTLVFSIFSSLILSAYLGLYLYLLIPVLNYNDYSSGTIVVLKVYTLHLIVILSTATVCLLSLFKIYQAYLAIKGSTRTIFQVKDHNYTLVGKDKVKIESV